MFTAARVHTLFILLISGLWVYPSFAQTPPRINYWICKAIDYEDNVFERQAGDRQQALNAAFAACKSDSKQPTSCVTAYEYCENVYAGRRVQAAWRCTAFDTTGYAWPGDIQFYRDDAVESARYTCEQASMFPANCYVRLITCHSKLIYY
ncbi:MAG: hypothetical protein GKR77_07795 [Legionellales bacterium]|nr:hypothetical protein [Legionellales bacterium]